MSEYLLTTLQLISFSIYIWETGSECPFGQATSTLWPRGNIMMDLDTHKCLDEPLILLCPAWVVLYSMANRMKKVVQFQGESLNLWKIIFDVQNKIIRFFFISKWDRILMDQQFLFLESENFYMAHKIASEMKIWV